MLHPLVALLATAASPAVAGEPIALMERGHDPARGVLVAHTVGGGFDPSRPTVVVVHGLNPFARTHHFVMAERYAEALGARFGAGVNVLGWDWNAATLDALRPRANVLRAVGQGYALAAALRGAGVDPAALHLIGHSTGGVVASAAARALADAAGRPVAHLTLIDPVTAQHRLIFDELLGTRPALAVDHYWAPGPSGFGGEARYPGVRSRAVPAPSGLRGLFQPSQTDHMNAVRWHLGVVGP